MSYIDLVFNRDQGLTGILRIESESADSPSAHVVIATQVGHTTDGTPYCPPLDVEGRYVYLGFMTENPSAANGFRPTGRWVAVKLAIGSEDAASFRHESSLLQGILAPLQGDVVPVFYGAWEALASNTANGNKGPKDRACMLLEWCCGDMPKKYRNSDELYQDLIVGVCKLHSAGVIHNKLLKDGGRDLVFGEDNSLRFIDCSMASVHSCDGISASSAGKAPAGCLELIEVGECLADVHRYYNMIKRVASKTKLRSNKLPVQVQIPVTFLPTGEYCAEW